jgi:hypothetical protein
MWLNHVGQASPASLSDGLQPVQYPLQQGQVGTVASMDRPVDHDQVLIGHVADQDADDAEGTVEVVETSVSISRSWWVGRVRPPVMA